MGKVVQVHRREQLLSLDAIDGLADRLAELDKSRRSVPDWLTVNKDQFAGSVSRIPTREDIQPIANDQAVVEFYSR